MGYVRARRIPCCRSAWGCTHRYMWHVGLLRGQRPERGRPRCEFKGTIQTAGNDDSSASCVVGGFWSMHGRVTPPMRPRSLKDMPIDPHRHAPASPYRTALSRSSSIPSTAHTSARPRRAAPRDAGALSSTPASCSHTMPPRACAQVSERSRTASAHAHTHHANTSHYLPCPRQHVSAAAAP